MKTFYHKFVQEKVPVGIIPVKIVEFPLKNIKEPKYLILHEENKDKDKYVGITNGKKNTEFIELAVNNFAHAVELIELAVDYFDGEDEQWLESAKEFINKLN